MPISITDFSPATQIKSAEVDTNFQVLRDALNNQRPSLSIFLEGAVSVDTNVSLEYEYKGNQDLTFDSVDLRAKTAPTGADLIVDININGSTIFSNRPEIADGSNTGGGSAVFSNNTLSNGDVVTFDIDQVGSTESGQDLTASVYLRL